MPKHFDRASHANPSFDPFRSVLLWVSGIFGYSTSIKAKSWFEHELIEA